MERMTIEGKEADPANAFSAVIRFGLQWPRESKYRKATVGRRSNPAGLYSRFHAPTEMPRPPLIASLR